MDDIRIGSLTLQPRKQLLAGGERVPMGRKALDILSVLAGAKGDLVTKDELLETVWPGVIVEENSIQVQISALRRALGKEAHRLVTVHGLGYRLDCPERPGAPAERHGDGATGRAVASRRTVLLAFVAAVILAGGLLGWWLYSSGRLGAGAAPVEVMVMKFTPAGASPDEAALASGITDELIVRLRRVPSLKVRIGPPAGAGGAAANRIDGSIRLNGKALRVSARLTDSKGNVLWSDNFDSQLVDLFTVQEDIARAVANALSVSLDVGIDSRSYGGTDNSEAYANAVQAFIHYSDLDKSRLIGHLERAIALDPHYAKALDALSWSYGLALYNASSKAEEEALLAKEDYYSARALAVKPDLWIGQSARAWYGLAKKNFVDVDARIQAMKALDKDEDPYLKSMIAMLSFELGRIREGSAYHQSRTAIDPYYRRDPHQIGTLIRQGRFDEGLALYEQLAAADPDLKTRGLMLEGIPGPILLYWAHLLNGDAEKAVAIAREAKLAPIFENVSDFRFDSQAMPDLPYDQLKQWADRTLGYGGYSRAWLMYCAYLASYHGHQKQALDYVKLAYQRPGVGAYNLLFFPALARLRATPEFAQFVTDLGLTAAWRKSGDWGDYCRPVSDTQIACR